MDLACNVVVFVHRELHVSFIPEALWRGPISMPASANLWTGNRQRNCRGQSKKYKESGDFHEVCAHGLILPVRLPVRVRLQSLPRLLAGVLLIVGGFQGFLLPLDCML